MALAACLSGCLPQVSLDYPASDANTLPGNDDRIGYFGASCVGYTIAVQYAADVNGGWKSLGARRSVLADLNDVWAQQKGRSRLELLALAYAFARDRFAGPALVVIPAADRGDTYPDALADALRQGQSDCQNHDREIRVRQSLLDRQ